MLLCSITITYTNSSLGYYYFMYRWRTKQNLDYTYSMMYARSRGTYYVQVLCCRCSEFSMMSRLSMSLVRKSVCVTERIFKIDHYLIFIKYRQQYGISFFADSRRMLWIYIFVWMLSCYCQWYEIILVTFILKLWIMLCTASLWENPASMFAPPLCFWCLVHKKLALINLLLLWRSILQVLLKLSNSLGVCCHGSNTVCCLTNN